MEGKRVIISDQIFACALSQVIQTQSEFMFNSSVFRVQLDKKWLPLIRISLSAMILCASWPELSSPFVRLLREECIASSATTTLWKVLIQHSHLGNSADLQAKKVESYMFNFIYYGVACCWPAHYYLFSLIAWPPISGWIWIPYSFGKMMTGYTYTILAFYTNSRLAHLVRLTGLAIHHWKIWNL